MADPTGTYEKGKLYNLPIDDLNPDTNQPRKFMEAQALEELTASVKTYGVIQPLLFRVDAESTNLFIVAGERRFEAAKIAGLTTVPAILVEGNTSEIALVENLLRQDLTPVEEAEALQRLKDEQKYSDEQLGAIIGKARTTLNEMLSLNKLPQEIRDECRGDRTINKSTLITIARKKQARAMMTAYNAYKAKQLKAPISKKTLETPNMIIEWVTKTTAKLITINSKLKTENYANWTEEAQASFQTTLANLKIEITNHQLL